MTQSAWPPRHLDGLLQHQARGTPDACIEKDHTLGFSHLRRQLRDPLLDDDHFGIDGGAPQGITEPPRNAIILAEGVAAAQDEKHRKASG